MNENAKSAKGRVRGVHYWVGEIISAIPLLVETHEGLWRSGRTPRP